MPMMPSMGILSRAGAMVQQRTKDWFATCRAPQAMVSCTRWPVAPSLADKGIESAPVEKR